MGQYSRVLNLLNTINKTCLILQLFYFLSLELFKIIYAPRFYYGNTGVSLESISDNAGYQDNIQPMGLIYMFAFFSVFFLSFIYSVAIVNCFYIKDWLSHTEAVIANSKEAAYMKRYLQVPQTEVLNADSALGPPNSKDSQINNDI